MTTPDPTARWTMPDWMEPYRHMIGNTGGNTVEDLLHRLDTEKYLSQTNIIVFTMAATVRSQVTLLSSLHRAGLLVTPEVTAVLEAVGSWRHASGPPGHDAAVALIAAVDALEAGRPQPDPTGAAA